MLPAEESPTRVARQLVAAVLRFRYLVLVTVCLGVGAHDYKLGHNDFLFFEYVGRIVLGRDRLHVGAATALHVYADIPQLQVGPPALALAVPFQLLRPSLANEVAALFMMICLAPCMYLLERVARLVGVPRRRTSVLALLAGLAMVPVWETLAVAFMHMDDVLVILLVLIAVGEVLNGRWLLASLAVATATVTKPWAIAVVPILFALPRPVWWKAGLAWIATFVLWWAPFYLAEPSTFVGLAGGTNAIAPGSTWSLFGLHGHPACAEHCIDVAWSWMRPLQFALSFLLAAAVVRRGRWLAAPLVGLLGRVVLDVSVWRYYGVGPVLMAVLCDAVAGRRLPWLALFVAGGEYSAYVVHNTIAQALIRIAVAGAVAAWYLRPHGRQATQEVAGDPELGPAVPVV